MSSGASASRPSSTRSFAATAPSVRSPASYVNVKDDGTYHLRRLRRRAVQLRHQVRLRHRLAELLRARGRRERRDPRGPQPRDGPHRGPVPPLRRPPRPRVRRRPQPDRPALLHQLAARWASTPSSSQSCGRSPRASRSARRSRYFRKPYPRITTTAKKIPPIDACLGQHVGGGVSAEVADQAERDPPGDPAQRVPEEEHRNGMWLMPASHAAANRRAPSSGPGTRPCRRGA